MKQCLTWLNYKTRKNKLQASTMCHLLLIEADEVPDLPASKAPKEKCKNAKKKSPKGSPKTKKASSKKPKKKDSDGSKRKSYELTPYGKAKKEFSLQLLGHAFFSSQACERVSSTSYQFEQPMCSPGSSMMAQVARKLWKLPGRRAQLVQSCWHR